MNNSHTRKNGKAPRRGTLALAAALGLLAAGLAGCNHDSTPPPQNTTVATPSAAPGGAPGQAGAAGQSGAPPGEPVEPGMTGRGAGPAPGPAAGSAGTKP